MTRLKRQLFFLFFFFLFIVTVPIVILSARGYLFDWNNNIFVFSGSISVKSWPRNIDIYLNGEKQKYRDLNIINNTMSLNAIRPGRYELRCEKPGYTSWQKTIDVHSGISTEFWNVLLFPLEKKHKTFTTPSVEQFFISPRTKGELVYFYHDNDNIVVSLLNTKENLSEEIYRSDKFEFVDADEKENVEWSSDNKSLLIPVKNKLTKEKDYLVAPIRRAQLGEVIEVSSLFSDRQPTAPNKVKNAIQTKNNLDSSKKTTAVKTTDTDSKKDPDNLKLHQVRWMFDQNKELVVLTEKQQLFYINIEKPNNKILIDEAVSGFNFAGNRIYYSKLPNNLIWEIKNNDITTKRQITFNDISIPENSFLSIHTFDQYRIAIITPNKELFLHNEEKEKGEYYFGKIDDNVNSLQFSNDGEKMLYWKDNEILATMLRDWEAQPIRKKGDKIFVTRFSSAIKNVQWLEDYENILFSNNNIVKVAELDNRDHINITDVINFPDYVPVDRDLIYDKSNQLLYTRSNKNNSFQLESFLLIDKENLIF